MQTREMRRNDRAISEEAAISILEAGEYGVLSTTGSDGLPYGVPLSYVVSNGKIFFHCATEGRKIDNLRFNPWVSFCVTGKTQPIFNGNYTTLFESAVAFGRVDFIEDEQEKRRILKLLAEKYLPEHLEKADMIITGAMSKTCVLQLNIESITGKAKR